MLRKADSCSQECFVQCFIKAFCNTKTFTCGFHFRSKADISATDLLKGEYRHLNCKIFCLRLKTRLISHILQLMSQNNSGSKRNDRNTSYLADVWYCTAGTRVNLDYIHLIAAYNKLDIDHTDYVKSLCQTIGIVCNSFFCLFTDRLSRIYGNTVS